ncbi:hypothetical protein L1887_27112 [Cichorium endivia]|nr:hypothetical protein L1887_33163 [Cichorium endivia]KAI3505172.1 hypothetical protein L1887_27112 [Cichorium endivia]
MLGEDLCKSHMETGSALARLRGISPPCHLEPARLNSPHLTARLLSLLEKLVLERYPQIFYEGVRNQDKLLL